MQFGQAIANFQALQHRMVRIKIKEEEARAAALFATLSLDGPAALRARAISGAKAKIGRARASSIRTLSSSTAPSEPPMGLRSAVTRNA